MQTKETVINKLIAELEDEKNKIHRLETFMTSADFMQITPAQKKLLEEQYDLMSKLKVTLIKRVYNLRWEDALEKGQAESARLNEKEKNQYNPVYETACRKCVYEKEPAGCAQCETCNGHNNFIAKNDLRAKAHANVGLEMIGPTSGEKAKE